MNTTVNIKDLAEFVIRYCHTRPTSISNLKLQKLLYYIQAWHLVYFKKHPLFNDLPEAWVNGPVYREIYYQYKEFGYDDIELDIPESKEASYTESLKKLNLTEKQQQYLHAVLNNYAEKDAGELVMRTHKEAPWNEARNGIGLLAYSDAKITFDMMYKYYSVGKTV